MSGTRIVVWGDDAEPLSAAAAELAAGGEYDVERTAAGPPWADRVDCVVTATDQGRVAAVRQEYDVPVVLFGDADGDAVRALLGAGASDVVQSGGSGSRAVLHERVEQALANDRSAPPADGAERVPSRPASGDGAGGGDGVAGADGPDGDELAADGRSRDGRGVDGRDVESDDIDGRDVEAGAVDGRDVESDAVEGRDVDGGRNTDVAGVFEAGEGAAARQYAAILEALEDGVYALDRNGRCSFVNEGMVELTGYAEAALLGADPGLVLDPRATARIEREIARQWDEREGTASVTVRTTIRREDGTRVPCELLATALADDDGAYQGTVGVLRDVSERERRQELLTQLQETSRSLMQAPSRETVARIVTDAAQRTLGFDICVFRLYDPDERTLVPVASTNATTAVMDERPTYELNEGPVGEVFVSGEPAVYDDVSTYEDEHDRSPVASAMYFPVGVHGALSIGTTEAAAFDDVDEQIATLLSTNAAAACNRAKREREVRDARERIATILERINGLVEDTIEVLVQATTRAEVERGVCEQLAAADPYVFAWIARPDVREERLVASEWTGDAGIDVADATLATAAESPVATAYAAGESRVLDADGLATAADGQPWVAAARAAGVASLMAVPLSYRGGSYGVLTVCSDRPDAFDDRERVVLEALGRAVANAINTVESGRILEADTVIELTVAIDGGEHLFGRLSAATGAALASAGTMSQDDGALRLFLTATGADADAVATALAAEDAVEETSLVAELDGESLFDVSVQAPLVATLVDHGAVPKAIAGADGGTRLTVELPTETAAREAFAIVERQYPGAELVGYHERERPVHTQQEFRAALSERFTDRQETALRTAYLGGFFDSPRSVDGDELAAGMDISRPTYHQHLRAAQRKVFEELFEADASA